MPSSGISPLPDKPRLDARQAHVVHELEDEFRLDSHDLRVIVDQFKWEFSQGLAHDSHGNKGSFLPMMYSLLLPSNSLR
jgi:hexokinase